MSRTMTISSWSASNVTCEVLVGDLAQPGEDLLVHAGHPGRRVDQAVAVGVLADREQDLPHGRLDAGRSTAGWSFGLASRSMAAARLIGVGADRRSAPSASVSPCRRDVRQVAVALGDVEAVADDEVGGMRKPT